MTTSNCRMHHFKGPNVFSSLSIRRSKGRGSLKRRELQDRVQSSIVSKDGRTSKQTGKESSIDADNYCGTMLKTLLFDRKREWLLFLKNLTPKPSNALWLSSFCDSDATSQSWYTQRVWQNTSPWAMGGKFCFGCFRVAVDVGGCSKSNVPFFHEPLRAAWDYNVAVSTTSDSLITNPKTKGFKETDQIMESAHLSSSILWLSSASWSPCIHNG